VTPSVTTPSDTNLSDATQTGLTLRHTGHVSDVAVSSNVLSVTSANIEHNANLTVMFWGEWPK